MFVNPLVSILTCIFLDCSSNISYGTLYFLLNHHDLLSLVFISFILMTCMFNQVVILQGEIRCLSLLGLKGFLSSPPILINM